MCRTGASTAQRIIDQRVVHCAQLCGARVIHRVASTSLLSRHSRLGVDLLNHHNEVVEARFHGVHKRVRTIRGGLTSLPRRDSRSSVQIDGVALVVHGLPLIVHLRIPSLCLQIERRILVVVDECHRRCVIRPQLTHVSADSGVHPLQVAVRVVVVVRVPRELRLDIGVATSKRNHLIRRVRLQRAHLLDVREEVANLIVLVRVECGDLKIDAVVAGRRIVRQREHRDV